MAVLPFGSRSPAGGGHLLCITITKLLLLFLLLLLLLPQPTESQCLANVPLPRTNTRRSYPLGMNISFECPYSGATRPSPVQSPNDTTLENTPDPVFSWTLKTSNSRPFSTPKPVQQVLGSNVWYSSPTTRRIMSTVLLTQNHIGTYTCKCTHHCSGAESHDFTVSGIEEGMVVRTNDFQVLASTCKDHRNSRVTANVGIKLHCTAILDQQRFDNDYPSRSDRQPRYCAGWWDSTSRRTCNTPYSAFESRRVSADKDGIHCSVAQLYGFPYYVYYYYYDHRLLYDIPINIIRKDAPKWKSCKASATSLHLVFDGGAYREEHGDDVEVVVEIGASKKTIQLQNPSQNYTGNLDQFSSDISVHYYGLIDGVASQRGTINLQRQCGRPTAVQIAECKANSSSLYLRFEEYKGSHMIAIVLKIELANSTVRMVNLTRAIEYRIAANVEKVEYYAILCDGEQSLKSMTTREECEPKPTHPPATRYTPTVRTLPTTRVYTRTPTELTLDQQVIITSVMVTSGAVAFVLGIAIMIYICYVVRQKKLEKAAAALAPQAPVHYVVRYRHNVNLNEPFPAGDELVSERAVEVEHFRAYVRERRSDDCARFRGEYSMLCNDNARMVSAFGKRVMAKNRYSNIIPYDHNRVVTMGDTDEDAYINGSFINGYYLPETYIAAQGPLPNTVCDFWEMVWEQRSRWIVMLTKVEEEGVRKCEHYWPESKEEPLRPGRDLVVELVNVEKHDEYDIRDFVVIKENREVWRRCRYDEPLPVRHFHFLGWPDHGVPKYPSGLLRFMQEVRNHEPDYITPKIVHCSAGVGRSGTFIALDYCMDRLADDKATARIVEVHGLVQMLRLQRPFMVQTEEQYIFIHDALLEYTFAGTRLLTPDQLTATLKTAKPKDKKSKLTGFEEEFDFMKEVSRKVGMIDQSVWLRFGLDNRYSGRYPYAGGHLDVLDERGLVVKEYINATLMDGHKQEKAYVAAQTPMPHSVNHFWSIIFWDMDIHSVVVLADFEENGKDTCYKFWPDKEMTPDVYGFVGVVMKQVIQYNGFTAYVCDICNEAQKKMKSREVVIFHYTRWPEAGRPAAYSHILALMGELEKIHQRSDNGRVLVACNDGMGRTGSFLCMHREIQRLKYAGHASVFQGARSLRDQRPYIIRMPEQYAAVYELIAEYLQSFDRYFELGD